MPEIVEVSWMSNYLNTYHDHQIENVKSLHNKYKASDFITVNGLIIDNVLTHGKLLWFEFKNSELILVCHFGLHGSFSHIKDVNSKIEMNLIFNDIHTCLYFNTKFNGSCSVITKNMLQNKLNKLGEDFFKSKIDSSILMNRLKNITKNKRAINKKIVTVLLDQNKSTGLGAGIGNYLVCEILYEANLSPHTTLGNLIGNPEKVTRLANAIIKILKSAYLTSVENYFKKIDVKILDYVMLTRKNMPLEYSYYPEMELDVNNNNNNNIFSCKVYKKERGPNGEIINVEGIVGKRLCYWCDERL